jgi:hypothetical protein
MSTIEPRRWVSAAITIVLVGSAFVGLLFAVGAAIAGLLI